MAVAPDEVRYLGLAEEVVGSYGAPIATYAAYKWTDVGEVAQNPSNEVIEAPSIMRDKGRMALGPYVLNGSVKTVADTTMLGYWLYGALGACTGAEIEVAPNAEYGHLFWPIKGKGALPSWTMIVGVDDVIERVISGMIMKSLGLSASAGGLLELSIDTVAKTEITYACGGFDVGQQAAIAFNDDERLLAYIHGTVSKIGGDVVKLEAFSLNVNNEVDDKWNILGSRFLQGVSEQNRTIEGSLTVSFEDDTEFSRFFAGGSTPTATAPATLSYEKFSLDLLFDTGIPIDAVTDVNNYMLAMYLPEIMYTSLNNTSSGRNRIKYELGFKATRGPIVHPVGSVYDEAPWDNEVTDLPLIMSLLNSQTDTYAGDSLLP